MNILKPLKSKEDAYIGRRIYLQDSSYRDWYGSKLYAEGVITKYYEVTECYEVQLTVGIIRVVYLADMYSDYS